MFERHTETANPAPMLLFQTTVYPRTHLFDTACLSSQSAVTCGHTTNTGMSDPHATRSAKHAMRPSK